MNVTLYNAKSGMEAFQNKLDVISNNIANVGTSGYKEVNVTFQELLKDEIGNLGTPLSTTLESKNPTLGSGAKIGDTYRNFEQGIMVPSSNALEIAIEGKGLVGFRDGNNALLLSRVGNISLNNKGKLVDENGNMLDVENGIDLSQYKADQIEIDQAGTITVKDETNGIVSAGKIVLYDTINKDELKEMGLGYYSGDEKKLMNSKSQDLEGYFGDIKQGYSEASNVNIGKELVDMITTQKAYQFNAKSIQAADDMWKTANNLTK